VNPDWRRLKAVVLESDDWGLCAWVPDDQAHRVLTGTPAFRTPIGRVYGRTTLERAEDVRALGAVLMEFRGGDGFPPVLQANTVMATPDPAKLKPPLFEGADLPLLEFPEMPSRWARPGLLQAMELGIEEGWWWPELHGLHHVPAAAWMHALRRGAADARRAHDQQCLVCDAVQASGEYAASEPLAMRKADLARAVALFKARFGRAPGSFCPPDYHWDPALDGDAEALGLDTFQGVAERAGGLSVRLQRVWGSLRFPEWRGKRFVMPPRIAFEPRGKKAADGPVGLRAALEGVRAAWGAGRPAVISTHRANFAHLDPPWMENGRAALRDLIAALVAEGAVFLIDAEVRGLVERGWSARPVGGRGALVRVVAGARDAVRWPAPDGVVNAEVVEGRGVERGSARIEDGHLTGTFDPGEYLVAWRRG